MPWYRCISPKRIMLARVQTLSTWDSDHNEHRHVAPRNEWISPGDIVSLSQAEYASNPGAFVPVDPEQGDAA